MSSSTSMPVLSNRLTTDPLGRTASFHSVGGSLSGSTYSVGRRRAHSDSNVPLKLPTAPLKFPTVSLKPNTGTLMPIAHHSLVRSAAAWIYIYLRIQPDARAAVRYAGHDPWGRPGVALARPRLPMSGSLSVKRCPEGPTWHCGRNNRGRKRFLPWPTQALMVRNP